MRKNLRAKNKPAPRCARQRHDAHRLRGAKAALHDHRKDRQHERRVEASTRSTEAAPPEVHERGMDNPNTMYPGIVREETCAIRQDAFCKVHRKFVTVNALLETPFFCSKYAANTGQIIYILTRLVTKKNVTVVREKASLQGDTLSLKVRSGSGLQRICSFSSAAMTTRRPVEKT